MTSPSLYELQRAFLAATTIAATTVAKTIAAEEPHAVLDARGLAVHRNNWRSNLSGALRASYPVVERLVGAEFFAYAANCFIDDHPSRSANLEEYGVEFAEFLHTFEPAQGLPYLVDIARLEKAIEKVLVVADDVEARCLLHSAFPVLRIWQVNQPGWEGDDSVNLETGPDYLLIYRADQDVLIEPIDRASFDAMADAGALQELDGAE